MDIDFDALFPGLNKDKPEEAPSFLSLLEMYRSMRAVLKRDGATDEEARDLALMVLKPTVEHLVYSTMDGEGTEYE